MAVLRQFLDIFGRALIFGSQTPRMGLRKKGVAAAVGLLCAAAATVAMWSGPLLTATAGFHASSRTAPVVAHAAGPADTTK